MLPLWSRLGRLLVSWTALMTIAGAAAYGLAIIPAAILGELPVAGLLISLAVAATLSGLIAGVIQRIYLLPYWRFSAGWVWASAIGMGIGIPLIVILSAVLREPVADWPDAGRLIVFLAAAALCGALSGLGQWWMLRSVTKRHPWWLFANAVGWLMAWILVLAIGFFVGGGEPLPTTPVRAAEALVLGGIAGLVVGFEQGVAIMGLFAQQAWEKSRKASTQEQ